MSRYLLLFVMISIMLAVGCGRTALNSPCDLDEDCPTGQTCTGGVCVPEDIEPEPDIGIPPEDGGVDTGEEDVQEEGCTSDLECGPGICRDPGPGDPVNGECAIDFCDLSTGECEVESCEPLCGPDEEQVGCNCIPETCDSNDECFGQICHNGGCRPCVSNAECSNDGTLVCDGGVCGPGPDCVSDDDCSPSQQCGPDQTCVERPECTFNDDCGPDEQCIAGTCTFTPECDDDDDCSSQSECVGGVCQARLCRGNNDCPGDQLCDGGDCVDPPLALTCEVVTSGQTLVPNQRIALQAFAYNAQGNGVAASFSWSSSDDLVAEIDGQELVGKSVPGVTTVTATLQGGPPVVCEGAPEFENLGLTQSDLVRVRVQNMQTGQPISGAEVHIGDNFQETDNSGIAELPDPGEAYEVSVFHESYNFLTVQGVQATDIRLPLSRRSGSGPVAGFTGSFDVSAIHTNGDIELGLAGASLAGDLLDLNLERLLGDPFFTEFGVPGLGAESVPLPGGVTAHGSFLGFQIEGKQTYYVQADEGPRLAWGIAGKLPVSDLLGVISNPPDSIGGAIGQFLPLFSRFDHGQQSRVFQASPRVLDVEDINNNGDTTEWLPDYNGFPTIDLLPAVRQQLTTEVNISSLPVLSGEQAEVAILLGATRTDSIGLVPLGISATSDEQGLGQPASQTLYMAPPYGSAVGGRYVVAAIAIATGGGAPGGGDALPSDFSIALWNGQSLNTSTSLGTFPDSSSGSVDEAARKIFIDDAKAGPIFRVRMVDTNRSWDIWSKGDGSAGQFSDEIMVSETPSGWSDMFAGDAQIFVDAVRSTVSIDDLVRSSGVGLERAGLVTTTFNRTTFR